MGFGLYDTITEISNRQVLKTDTGDNRIYGVIVGKVTKNYDESMPGKVCVAIPTRGDGGTDADVLKWARVATNYMGTNWGTYFLPEVGDEVLVIFENGDIERPYIIGSIARTQKAEASKLHKASVDKDNQYKTITTKHGSRIRFNDMAGDGTENGEKDKILIETPGETGQQILLDNENEELKIFNKKKKTGITMKTKESEGVMTIQADKKILIEVKGENTVRVELDGTSGKILIKGKAVTIDASDNVNVVSNSNVKVEGSSVKVNGSSSVSLTSDGSTKVSGKMVQL